MSKAFALTTFDNPFDPFEQFDEWYLFDVVKGYNSCGYLARISRTSDAMTDEENAKEIERAIDEIVRNDPFNMYYKAEKEIDDDEPTDTT